MSDPSASDLRVSWESYHASIESLVVQVARSGFEFDTILCLARGGLRIGDVFSRVFRKPLAILSTSSYRAEGGTQQGALIIAEHVTAVVPTLGPRVLLIDDMADSGHTLEAVVGYVRARYPRVEVIKTAVLWHKAHSVYVPDFAVTYVASNAWIHQPFEHYDTMEIDALARRTP